MPGLSGVVPSPLDLPNALSEATKNPDVDIMASIFYKKLDRFVARFRNRLAFAVDALVIPWSPFRLVHFLSLDCSARQKGEQIPVFLIDPKWYRRTWYTYILGLLFHAGQTSCPKALCSTLLLTPSLFWHGR